MIKVFGSVAFLIVMVLAGYFADPKFKSQIDNLVGHNKPVAVASAIQGDTFDAPAVTSDASLQRVLEASVINVSVENPSKPFFSNENSQARGFNVDFMNVLFAQSEFKGKIRANAYHPVDTYSDVPKQLLNNRSIDIAIDGLTFNDEDLPGVVYTIPYVKDFGYSLITAKGNTIQNVSDTAGMKIGVLKGDPDVKAFVEQAFPGAKIVELSDKADANGKWIVGHIDSHRVDAVVYDYPFAVAEVEGTDLQFAMTKIKGSDIQYRIGVRKEDKALLAALNSAIRKVMDTPEYTAMLKTYFMSTSVAAVRRASSGEVSYIVVKGDTLSTIAQAQLGDRTKFGIIQTRNNLANPNFITIGQKLVIPSR